jgi:hypothetical protein
MPHPHHGPKLGPEPLPRRSWAPDLAGLDGPLGDLVGAPSHLPELAEDDREVAALSDDGRALLPAELHLQEGHRPAGVVVCSANIDDLGSHLGQLERLSLELRGDDRVVLDGDLDSLLPSQGLLPTTPTLLTNMLSEAMSRPWWLHHCWYVQWSCFLGIGRMIPSLPL